MTKETIMTDTKNWYESRTVWVNLVATLFAVLGAFKLLPVDLDQDQVVTTIMAFVGVANVLLRLRTSKVITPTPKP